MLCAMHRQKRSDRIPLTQSTSVSDSALSHPLDRLHSEQLEGEEPCITLTRTL